MKNGINTKIIATIGPATLDFQVFQDLVNEGIDYIRINTSYGNSKQYEMILDNLKRVNKDKQIDVILDIKDVNILDFASKNNISKIALSFAENSEQIGKVREKLPGVYIISKIESEVGVSNFDGILESSDGIMVARGDLGDSVTLEKVPALQKEFTLKTLERKKFLITATEMLLSMTTNPQPTRAEVSDVANAVFEHSSAVMLSEETAIGKYPVETVRMMKKIIVEAEKWNNIHEK